MKLDMYLHAVRTRFQGIISEVLPLASFSEIPDERDVIINCSGFGARALVGDTRLHPHRGQVVLTPPQPSLPYAVVYEDALTYVIPRSGDCVLGGTNDVSDDLHPNDDQTRDIRRRSAAIVP